RLTALAKQLNTAFNSAKTALERDYLKMIDEPQLDISGSQNAYQTAWSEVKKNQQDTLLAEQTLQEMHNQLVQLQASQDAIQQ
ncbi:hypothetical protein P8629_12460, partial [Hydrogenovibrio sp. 3SP14C1]